MGLKLKFVTNVPDKLEECLQKLQSGLIDKGRGQVYSMYHKIGDKTFMVMISYPLTNPLSNRIIKREFVSTLKKVDPNIKIDIVK